MKAKNICRMDLSDVTGVTFDCPYCGTGGFVQTNKTRDGAAGGVVGAIIGGLIGGPLGALALGGLGACVAAQQDHCCSNCKKTFSL